MYPGHRQEPLHLQQPWQPQSFQQHPGHPHYLQQLGQRQSFQQHPVYPGQQQQQQLGQPQSLQQHPWQPHQQPQQQLGQPGQQQQLGQPLKQHPGYPGQHQQLGQPGQQQQLGQPLQQHPGYPGQHQQLGQPLQQHPGYPGQHQQLGQPLQQHTGYPGQHQQLGQQHPGYPGQHQQLGQQHPGYPGQHQQLGQQHPGYPGQHQELGQQHQSEQPTQWLQQQQSGYPGQPYTPINPPPNGYIPPVTKMAQLSPTLPQTFINHLQLPPFSTPPPSPPLPPPPLPPLPALPPPPQQSPSFHSPNHNAQQLVSLGQTHQPPIHQGQPYHQHPGDEGQRQQSLFPEKPRQRQPSGYPGQQAYMSMNPTNEHPLPKTGTMPPMGMVCYPSPPLSRPACLPNPGSGGEANMPPPLPRPPVTSPICRPLIYADITPIEKSQRTVEKSHPRSGGEAGMAPPFPSPPLLMRPPVTSPIVRPLGSPDITSVEKSQTTVYVGKIAPSVGNGFIRSLLKLCGPIKSWKRAHDPSDGAPNRFGFCEFESAEGVLRALRLLSKCNFNGQELVLNVNQPTRDYLEHYVAKKKEELSKQSERGVEEAKKGEFKADNDEDAEKNESRKHADKELNFGLITDDDRNADREASEKLTKLIEEHIKKNHLSPPPPPFQGVADGSGSLNSEMRSKSEDRHSDIDTVNYDKKSDNERTHEIKSARRTGTVSPRWKRSGNRWRDWERSRDEQEQERLERVSYRFEKELQRCRATRDYEVQKAERLYHKRLEEWEVSEREKEYTWMYDEIEKKKRRERMQLTADQEDESDDDCRKRRHKYAIEEKRRRRWQRLEEEGLTDKIKEDDEITEAGKRDEEEEGGHEEEQELGQKEKEEGLTDKMKEDGEITEGERDNEEEESQHEEQKLWQSVNEEGLTDKIKEDDEITEAGEMSDEGQESEDELWQRENEEGLTDKIKEDGEITKAKKRDKEEQESPEEGQDPQFSYAPVANEGETSLLSETESGEIIDKMEVDQSHLADPASEYAAGDDVLENVKTDEPATASGIRSDSASDLKVSANPAAEKLELGVMLSGKQTTVLSVFHEEDDENAQNYKMRPLVHINYSIKESHATHKNDGQVPAAAAESSKHISPKDVKSGVEKERSKCSHDRSSVREFERDDDHSQAPRILDVKQLIDMIPKTKDELVSYEINWAIYDEYCLYERMRPWISSRTAEFLGEEEAFLVEFIADKFRQHVQAEKMMELLQQILDEEAEMFVLRMWKMLIFEIKRAETVVMLRQGV